MSESHNVSHLDHPHAKHVADTLQPKRPELQAMTPALAVAGAYSKTGHGVLFGYGTEPDSHWGVFGHAIRLESIAPFQAFTMGRIVLLSAEAIICQIAAHAGVPRKQLLNVVWGREPKPESWRPPEFPYSRSNRTA